MQWHTSLYTQKSPNNNNNNTNKKKPGSKGHTRLQKKRNALSKPYEKKELWKIMDLILLFIYCQTWGLALVVCSPSEIPGEKTNFSFVSDYYWDSFCIRNGGTFPLLSVLWTSLVKPLCLVPQSPWVHVYVNWLCLKGLIFLVFSNPSSCTIFYLFLHRIPRAWRGGILWRNII